MRRSSLRGGGAGDRRRRYAVSRCRYLRRYLGQRTVCRRSRVSRCAVVGGRCRYRRRPLGGCRRRVLHRRGGGPGAGLAVGRGAVGVGVVQGLGALTGGSGGGGSPCRVRLGGGRRRCGPVQLEVTVGAGRIRHRGLGVARRTWSQAGRRLADRTDSRATVRFPTHHIPRSPWSLWSLWSPQLEVALGQGCLPMVGLCLCGAPRPGDLPGSRALAHDTVRLVHRRAAVGDSRALAGVRAPQLVVAPGVSDPPAAHTVRARQLEVTVGDVCGVRRTHRPATTRTRCGRGPLRLPRRILQAWPVPPLRLRGLPLVHALPTAGHSTARLVSRGLSCRLRARLSAVGAAHPGFNQVRRPSRRGRSAGGVR